MSEKEGLCLKHDTEIEYIKREIKEIKEENRIQNKEFREIFSNFSDIKEAIVTSSLTLQRLNEKMDVQEQQTREMSKKFEKTTKELSDKFDILDKKVEGHGKVDIWDYLKRYIPWLILVGLGYLLMNIEKFLI